MFQQYICPGLCELVYPWTSVSTLIEDEIQSKLNVPAKLVVGADEGNLVAYCLGNNHTVVGVAMVIIQRWMSSSTQTTLVISILS